MAGTLAPPAVSIASGLGQIYRIMSRPRRRQLHALLALMFVAAIAELATIGSVLPFLGLLTDPEGLGRLPWPADRLALLASASDPLLVAGLLFAAVAIAAAIIRLRLAWSIQDFAYSLGHELLIDMQRRILLQPYAFHIERNSSSLITAMDKVEMLIFDVLLPTLQALVSGVLAAFIFAALVYIDPFTALAAAAAFAAVYVVVSKFASAPLARNSDAIASSYDERLKIAQESLGGIRDVIIDNSHAAYLDSFERVDRRLNRARSSTAFIASAPRFIIEALGMAIVTAIAVAVSQRSGGLAAAIPILGAIALGAQRLLPLTHQVYAGWSNAAGQRSILGQVVELLELPVEAAATAPRQAPLPLKDRISVEQVSFAYPNRRSSAVDEISFDIPRGSSLALVGETGSGKSTLADIIMGLLEPGSGRVSIDGVALGRGNVRRWQAAIAHVPQAIFLADSSIAHNIALSAGEEALDMGRVVEASTRAQLHEFVASLPDGYDTRIGERGIRLSGGQRQRLGIARAIYKQAPVLVLDEATSALDEATEAAVIDSLASLGAAGRTIIIIAHRASTIARCDRIARLHKGRLVESGAVSGGNSVTRSGARS